MNSNSPLGAIPAVVSRLMATRRATASSAIQPVKSFRVLAELGLLLLVGTMIATVGFGLTHETAGKLIAASLMLRTVLQTLSVSRLFPQRLVGSPPPTLNYVLSTIATALIFVAAFINPAAYAAFGVLTALIVVRLLLRLMPAVHAVMMDRYAGHVERMESEHGTRTPQ